MISRDRWARLKPLVERALALTPEEFPRYLDRACWGKPELREDLDRLVRACVEAGRSLDFLEGSAAEFAAPLLNFEAPSQDGSVGRYVIERRLGAGGMGVVYLARDPRLDRRVALKLLPSWFPADEVARRRVVQEAMAASQLDHPNIQTVYEIGETADDRPYIAMAYYEGETLRDRIARGPLTIDSVVDLACQIAEGLAAAHAHGIVHRDVKPSNVIITPAGVAKILDFGAAKLTAQEAPDEASVVGTVAYMSPEQTRREELDSRTDIWSFGAVLYEMLTARHPFATADRGVTIDAIRGSEPAPLLRWRQDVPRPLARVVQRCLKKDRRARFRDGSSMLRALHQVRDAPTGSSGRGRAGWRPRVLGTAAIAVAGIIGAAVFWTPTRTDDASPLAAAVSADPIRLAVLPLVDTLGAAEGPTLGDGLTEDLIASLSHLGGLRVIASASVMPYKGTGKTLSEIARELDVTTVLTGTARPAGSRVELSLRLTDADGRDPIWARHLTTGIEDLVAVQRNIADEVAAALHVQLPARERALLARRGTANAEAFALYHQGRHFLAKLATPGATQQARESFERAIDLDPTFALAWAGLSGAYNQLGVQGTIAAADAGPRARRAAERALEFDPDLAEAHNHLAAVLSWYYWDMEGAERHFQRALELEPSSARTRRHYAVHLRSLGRFEEALAMVRTAGELDPLSVGTYYLEGAILYMARRYDEALTRYRHVLLVDPHYVPTYFAIALAYTQMGLHLQALAALQKADPQVNHTDAYAIRGYVYARAGRLDEARRILARLDSLSASRPISSFPSAVIFVGLGNYDRALELLEQAADQHAFHVRLLKVEPVLDPLRSRPRFQALLRRVNLVTED